MICQTIGVISTHPNKAGHQEGHWDQAERRELGIISELEDRCPHPHPQGIALQCSPVPAASHLLSPQEDFSSLTLIIRWGHVAVSGQWAMRPKHLLSEESPLSVLFPAQGIKRPCVPDSTAQVGRASVNLGPSFSDCGAKPQMCSVRNTSLLY